jgi:hypothetical protein
MTDLVKLARQRIDDTQRTHWEGCERDHRECLIQRMADQIERLQAECLRLNHAEAEAMSVVLSQARHMRHIERLQHQMNNDICEIERLREAMRGALTLLAQAQAVHTADSFPISNAVGLAQDELSDALAAGEK